MYKIFKYPIKKINFNNILFNHYKSHYLFQNNNLASKVAMIKIMINMDFFKKLETKLLKIIQKKYFFRISTIK